MVRVYLRSEEYGEEEFDYASISEALEGISRLAHQSLGHFGKDGIEREITLRIGGDDENVDEGEEDE
jgi:hypothetical protein